ncbi:MAG: hypothetical protein K2G70_05950 [Turicibacter sp.]|nr:hypothetical protein [Turicibacter sp.]
MSTGRTKTISFPKKDYDIKEYLSNIDNMSEYIIRLVRNDLENKNSNSEDKLDFIINELADIKKTIANGEFKTISKKQKPQAQERLSKLSKSLIDD